MKPFHLIGILILVVIVLAAGFVVRAQSSKSSGAIAHFNSSLTAEENGKYADALKEMEAIPADARSDYAVVLRFGWVNYENQKYDAAVRYYERAATASGNKSIEALLGLTLPLAAKQDWSQVEATYEKILAMDPANYTANLRLGQIYMNRADYSMAAEHLGKALEHYPAAYEAVLSSAWNELSLGRTNDARKLFERALMLSPGDTSATRGLSSLK